MQVFVKIEDHELWNIVTNGPYILMTTVDGKVVKKSEY